MKSVSSNLAKLKSDVEWAVLPLSDRTGWTRVRFGDVVENCAETCDPQGAELEQFVTLSRGVCSRFLVSGPACFLKTYSSDTTSWGNLLPSKLVGKKLLPTNLILEQVEDANSSRNGRCLNLRL